jgi:NAD(P)H-nitrite reductase large subunit
MPSGVQAVTACLADPSATVCTCMSVSRREIVGAIGSLGLKTVEQVGEHTQAGTGCGTCRGEIRSLLAVAAQEASEVTETTAAA